MWCGVGLESRKQDAPASFFYLKSHVFIRGYLLLQYKAELCKKMLVGNRSIQVILIGKNLF